MVAMQVSITTTFGGETSVTYIQGEEVLANLGYELQCSRFGGYSNTACWYDLLVPLGAILSGLLLSVLMLRFCVRDPH